MFIWDPAEKRGDRRFHNRYIVTDQCAVAANDALACLREGRTNWDLLDADERRVVLRDLDEHVHARSLLARRRLAGQ